MSIIGWAVTALIPGGGIIGAVLKFGARTVFGKIGGALKSAGKFVGTNWKPLLVIAAIGAAVVYVLILKGEIRHRDKTIAGQAVLIGDVKKEVDAGVGKPTSAADAPWYIHAFVGNVRAWKAAARREEAAARAAHADAVAVNAGAHQDRQATSTEQQNEKVRAQIADPARTTGLSAQEWSHL